MLFHNYLLRFAFTLTVFLIFAVGALAQQFNFQGVARKPDGTPMANQNITVKLTIPGTSFSETHSLTTNDFGLFKINVGSIGSLAGINWSTPKNLSVEINSSPIGTSALNYVPYAIFSEQLRGFSFSATTPSSGQVLKWNGTAWAPGTDNSGSVAVNLPITSTTISGVTTLSIPAANATTDGYLSFADWNLFKGKQDALNLTTSGNSGSSTFNSATATLNIPTYTLAGLGGISLTDLSVSAPLSYNTTTGAFSISKADASTDGYLTKVDWDAFNGKEPAITSGVTTQYWRGDKSWQTLTSDAVSEGSANLYYTDTRSRTALSATAPIAYNATSGLLSLPQANSSTDGYLNKVDWSTFNGKEPGIATGTTAQYWRGDKSWQTLTSDAVSEGGTNLYYTNARSRTALSATAPIAYNATSGQLSLPQANGTTNGYLSFADWNLFKGKQDALNLTTSGNSGSSTFNSATATLNIPAYTLAGLGGISLTNLTASAPLSYNSTTGDFSISKADAGTDGYLSKVDWDTFNKKLAPNSAITAGTNTKIIYDAKGLVIGSAQATAADILNTALGNISATTVQGAIIELDAEKVDLTTDQSVAGKKTFTNDLTAATKLTINTGSNSFSFPATRGSNGAFLVSNGTGGTNWVTSNTNKTIEINDGTTSKTLITEYYTIYTGNPGFNLSLPSVSGLGNGKEYIVKNLCNNASSILVILTSGSDSIVDGSGGGNNIQIQYSEWIKFVSYGGNWYVFKGL